MTPELEFKFFRLGLECNLDIDLEPRINESLERIRKSTNTDLLRRSIYTYPAGVGIIPFHNKINFRSLSKAASLRKKSIILLKTQNLSTSKRN